MKKLVLIILMMTQFGFSQVGINTTNPQAQLDIKSSNQVTPSNTDGILIPKIDAFPLTNPTAAQQAMMVYLTTISAGKQPGFYYWDQPTTSWKGFNIGGEGMSKYYTVVGTTDITCSSTSTLMAEMTQTFTPNSNVVLVQFAAASYNNISSCGQSPLFFTILLDGIPVKSTQTSMEDVIPSGRVIWDMNVIYPVTVTPGISHTISINWFNQCNFPAHVSNNVVTAAPGGVLQAFRTLTIIDPNGGGGIVGSPPVATNLWALNGNSGTNASVNFLGTIDNVDLVFKRSNVRAGLLNVNNTSFGTNALNPATTGIYNTAFGANALLSATNGQYNTAVGTSALYANTSGNYNMASGLNSLRFNTDGQQNVGYGVQSLFKNIDGDYNTATGTNSLYENENGNNNTATGHSALYNNKGSNNTAVGFSAMASNSTGINNTAIGYEALYSNTNGGSNTAIGNNSLFANSTGFGNVALGWQSLYTNVSGTGNVALGYQAGSLETGSYKLYIENSGSTTPLIYGEFDNDLARINGNFRIKSTSIASNEMQIKNSNLYNHPADINLNFGTGGGYFMVSTMDASPSSETGGIRGDGDNVSIWSPGDGGRQLRILDEDNWSDNNGNPYDNGAEVAYIASNGQYFQVSDKNKKENIVKIEKASDKITQISGYTYQYKLNKQEIEKGQQPVSASGVLAQEIEKVLPEAIQKNENGEYFVDYAAITPLLIEALKEQNAKIKAFEERLKKLEEK